MQLDMSIFLDNVFLETVAARDNIGDLSSASSLQPLIGAADRRPIIPPEFVQDSLLSNHGCVTVPMAGTSTSPEGIRLHP
jgi:hypothetical protein